MDTVTESRLAIALAQQADWNHSPQSFDRRTSKRSRQGEAALKAGMIVDLHMSPDDKISDALEVMRKYKISGVQ